MISGEVNLLSWVLYALAVGLLVSGAAWSVSFGLQRLRLPTRWVWALALALTVVLPVSAILLPTAPDAAERSGQVQPATAQAPDGVPAGPIEGRRTQEGSSLGSVLLGWGADRAGEAAAWANGLLGWSTSALPARPGFDRWAPAVWGATTLLLAILLFASAWHMNRRRYRWPITVLLGQPVRLTPDLGPAVSGVLRPEILLPRWALSLEGRALDVILRHEEEHLRARDPLLLAGALALVVLVPWNLWLWWQFRRLRDAVELDCDRRVLHRGVAAAVYGHLLVELGSRHRGDELLPALAMSRPLSLIETAATGTPSLLERRLNAMKKRSARSALPLAIFGTAAGIALFVMACELDTPTHLPDEGATTETAEAETLGADGPDAQAPETHQRRGGSVRIRAPTSVRTEDPPLVVVDGVILGSGASRAPEEGDAGAGEPEAIPLEGLDLDPASISSIEVLKGEAARELYGERGRNGVLLITTERGDGPVPGVERTETSPEPRGGDGPVPGVERTETSDLSTDDAGAVSDDDSADRPRYLDIQVYRDDTRERLDFSVDRIGGDRTVTSNPNMRGLLDPPASGGTRGPSPLYVVDGVIAADPDMVLNLDENLIESVEVVKGAKAQELYGTRAAGGVVQITTRRGGGA